MREKELDWIEKERERKGKKSSRSLREMEVGRRRSARDADGEYWPSGVYRRRRCLFVVFLSASSFYSLSLLRLCLSFGDGKETAPSLAERRPTNELASQADVRLLLVRFASVASPFSDKHATSTSTIRA